MIKVILIIIVLLIVGTVSVLIAGPFRLTKINGGEPGNYKKGETVLAINPSVYWGEIKNGDVVIFKKPEYDDKNNYTGTNDIDYIAEVVNIPGDEVKERAFYFNNLQYEGILGPDLVAIRIDKVDYLRIIPKANIKGIVVYPNK